MNHRNWIVAVTAILLIAMFAVSALAAPENPQVSAKNARLQAIAQKVMNGQPVTPEEKAAAYGLIEEMSRANSPVNPPAIDTQGGPDAFGYRWIDNNAEPTGPVYNWVDISATGTEVGINGDDVLSAAIPIGFTFPYYGTNYTTFKVCTNGYMYVDASQTSQTWTNQTLPATSVPNSVIAPFWDDMVTSSNAMLKYQVVEGRLVVSWLGISSYSGGTGTYTFQVILDPSGSILFQYNTLGSSVASSTIGIENTTGTVGLQIQYNGTPANTMAVAGRAILISTLGPATNPVPANGATNVPTNAVLSWTAASGATGYDVYWGTDNPPMTMVSSNQAATNYTPASIAASTTYYWSIVARNAASTNAGPVWSFTSGAGAAPNAPSNGVFTNALMQELTGTFQDNSTDETSFPYYTSTDGANFTFGGSWAGIAGTGTRPWGFVGLTPATHYWGRVFATGPGGTSTGYAEANGWTLANVPAAPSIGTVSHNSIGVTINNSGAPANGAAAQYALYETTTNTYVQADGTLGATAGWGALRTVTVTGLTSGATYTFQAKARNGAGVETAFGPTVSQATNDINAGGPDGGGYRYKNQLAAGGPTYGWITPSGAATTVTGWSSTDDGSAGPFNFGFNFNWYGTTYTQWYAGSNGRIQFGAQDPYSYTQAALPLLNYPAGLYFWNGDMSVSSTTVQYENLTGPNRLVITYTNLRNLGNTYGLDAQAIIYETGEVLMQFGPQTGAPSFIFSGIQSNLGANYLTYPMMPTNGTAILYFSLGAPSTPVPANLATGVPTNTQLSWAAGAGATGYDVYFGTDNPPMTLVSANQAGLNYTPTLAPSTTYYWKVVSLMGASTNAGPVWSFTTGAGAAPNAPTDATFISATTNTITGSFMDNSTNETGFPFYGSLNGTDYTYAFTAPGVAGTGVRSQTLFMLTAGTHYWTRIFAEGAGGTSLNYAETNAWTLPATPAAPTLGAPTFSTIPITLNNNATDPNGAGTVYSIRVNGTLWVQGNGSLSAVQAEAPLAAWNSPPLVVNGLAGNTSYTFEVIAKAGTVSSAFSPSATVSTTSWSPNPNTYTPAVGVLPAAILDVTTTDIPIIVTGTGAVTDIDVRISGTHTWVSDVSMNLIHPSGAPIVPLFLNRGGSADNWTNMILDDEAAASIATGAAPFTGTWIPEQPLSGFDFLEASGTWILRVYDAYNGDTGQITSLELAMGINAAAPPGAPYGPTPTNGAVAIGPNPILGWSAANATTYDVYLGTTNPPTTAVSMGQAGTTFAAGPLTQSSTYYWYINAHNVNGATPGPVWSFTTATPPTSLAAVNDGANVTLNWNPSTGGEQAYVENFSGPTAPGFTFYNAGSTYMIDGGYLKAVNTQTVGNWDFQGYYANTYTDVSVETSLLRPDDVDNSYIIGLLVHGNGGLLDGTGTPYSGYVFGITTNGYYNVWVVTGGTIASVTGWVVTPLVNTVATTPNVVKVNAVGNQYAMYINGTLAYTLTDASFPSGLVGMGSSGTIAGSAVWWDYFRIQTAGFTLTQGQNPATPAIDRFVSTKPGYVSMAETPFCNLPAVNNPYNRPIGYASEAIDAFINYRIYRNSTLLATTTDTSYADVLPDYGTYTYYVTSVYTEGESNPTNNAVITYLPPTPGDPTALTITYSGGNAVLNWTGSTGTVTGYHVYRFATGYFTPPTSGTLIGSTDNATFTYTDTGVNGQYYYRVTAYNGIATSSTPTGGSESVIRTLTPTTK
ncbi:MAG: hypothetical protein OEM52_01995 [bacterium]|nr:hypothetical protein [bacterium]